MLLYDDFFKNLSDNLQVYTKLVAIRLEFRSRQPQKEINVALLSCTKQANKVLTKHQDGKREVKQTLNTIALKCYKQTFY